MLWNMDDRPDSRPGTHDLPEQPVGIAQRDAHQGTIASLDYGTRHRMVDLRYIRDVDRRSPRSNR
jgi:hypothetical protein